MLEWIPQKEPGRPLRILCLGAHSDDIEIGCGASLLQWARSEQPLDIRWVVFSGGQNRAEEARNSAAFWLERMDSSQVELHDFRDGFFPGEWGAIKEQFETLKTTYAPDIVMTHARSDLHQDHRIINELSWNTFRNHFILEYEIPKFDGDLGSPNFYIPLSEDAARSKTEALMRFFGSQSNKHWFSEELFLGLMRIRGMECCSDSGYAEGFYVRKASISM